MKDDFYLTLPSHSSLQEFPQNANNNFKVRLPAPIRLNGEEWKVALASISVPNPKNAIPSWLHDDLTLFNYTCYYADKNNINTNKMGFQTDVKLSHIKHHVDLSMMTAHGFLKGLIQHTQKLYLQRHLFPGWLTGYASKIQGRRNYFGYVQGSLVRFRIKWCQIPSALDQSHVSSGTRLVCRR